MGGARGSAVGDHAAPESDDLRLLKRGSKPGHALCPGVLADLDDTISGTGQWRGTEGAKVTGG
jgi:hypothetical protein